MGMFDDITFKGSLPNGVVGASDQTKAFDCVMAHHEIDELGRLWLDNGHMVSVPKSDRKHPDAPDGSFASMFGSVKWIRNLQLQETFTGTIDIVGYDLHFFNGQLVGFRQGTMWHPFTGATTHPAIEDVVLPPTWGLVNGKPFGATDEALTERIAFLESALKEAVDCGSFRIEVIPDDSTIYKGWRHKGETVILGTAATEEFIAGDPKTEPNLAKWLSEASK